MHPTSTRRLTTEPVNEPQSLARLEELVRKVVDLVDNRVEMNLRAISNTMLVDLPADKSFTYDEFIATQTKFQATQSQKLQIRNEEVRACLLA